MVAAEIPNPNESRPLQLAMRLSLAVGFFVLGTKVYAYWMTGSAVILSDLRNRSSTWWPFPLRFTASG